MVIGGLTFAPKESGRLDREHIGCQIAPTGLRYACNALSYKWLLRWPSVRKPAVECPQVGKKLHILAASVPKIQNLSQQNSQCWHCAQAMRLECRLPGFREFGALIDGLFTFGMSVTFRRWEGMAISRRSHRLGLFRRLTSLRMRSFSGCKNLSRPANMPFHVQRRILPWYV